MSEARPPPIPPRRGRNPINNHDSVASNRMGFPESADLFSMASSLGHDRQDGTVAAPYQPFNSQFSFSGSISEPTIPNFESPSLSFTQPFLAQNPGSEHCVQNVVTNRNTLQQHPENQPVHQPGSVPPVCQYGYTNGYDNNTNVPYSTGYSPFDKESFMNFIEELQFPPQTDVSTPLNQQTGKPGNNESSVPDVSIPPSQGPKNSIPVSSDSGIHLSSQSFLDSGSGPLPDLLNSSSCSNFTPLSPIHINTSFETSGKRLRLEKGGEKENIPELSNFKVKRNKKDSQRKGVLNNISTGSPMNRSLPPPIYDFSSGTPRYIGLPSKTLSVRSSVSSESGQNTNLLKVVDNSESLELEDTVNLSREIKTEVSSRESETSPQDNLSNVNVGVMESSKRFDQQEEQHVMYAVWKVLLNKRKT